MLFANYLQFSVFPGRGRIVVSGAIFIGGGCRSVAKSCPTLCDPMDSKISGFLVLHHLLESAQTHVHWVSDGIQPAHPLSPSSPPPFNVFQHQGLSFYWGDSNLLASGLWEGVRYITLPVAEQLTTSEAWLSHHLELFSEEQSLSDNPQWTCSKSQK